MSHFRNLPLRHAFHLDGLSSTPDRLYEVENLERIIREVAKIAGMAILHLTTSDVGMEIKRLFSREPQPNEIGFSCLASLSLISTSHIALHVWPETGYFMFDLVSCKPFDAMDVRFFVSDAVDMREALYENHVDVAAQKAFKEGLDKQFQGQ